MFIGHPVYKSALSLNPTQPLQNPRNCLQHFISAELQSTICTSYNLQYITYYIQFTLYNLQSKIYSKQLKSTINIFIFFVLYQISDFFCTLPEISIFGTLKDIWILFCTLPDVCIFFWYFTRYWSCIMTVLNICSGFLLLNQIFADILSLLNLWNFIFYHGFHNIGLLEEKTGVSWRF